MSDIKDDENNNSESSIAAEAKQSEETSIKADASTTKTKQSDADAKAKVKAEPLAAPKARGPGWIAYSFLVLAFGGLLGVLYIGVKHGYKTKAAIENEIVQLREEIQSMEGSTNQALSSAQNKIDQSVKQQLKQAQNFAQKNQTELIARMNELNKRLDGHQQRLVSLSTTSKEDWLLAEAEYLLKLANQRVLLEKSPINALALLAEADKIVHRVAAGLGDHELHAIREAIARELIALKSVELVDREGIYLKLSAIAEGVDNINTIPTFSQADQGTIVVPMTESEMAIVPETPISDFDKEKPPIYTWDKPVMPPSEQELSWFAKFKREFRKTGKIITEKYIRIQDNDERTAPAVTQRTLHLMQLNVRMLLEQAQLALLKQDQTLYDHSLNQAQTLFISYYPPAAPEYKLQAEIASLVGKNISPALPDISNSLKLLHDFIEEQHRLNPQSPKNQMQVGGVSP